MDRLISLEPSNTVAIKIEPPGLKSSGDLTLRNVMFTMPVAFRLTPVNKSRYTVKPQSGIISPLSTLTVEIMYHTNGQIVPDSFPHCPDSFLLHSVVVPGAAAKDNAATLDAVPTEWFTARKKQVFVDSGIKVVFVGSPVLGRLVASGSMEEVRMVLERSDPEWRAVDSVDSNGDTMLHLAISQSRPDLVQLLLEFDPDVEARGRAGSSALEAASAIGDALIVELLLARKASTERSERSNLGPIHLAAASGGAEVLRLLLLKGANVNALTRDGNTALHLAVEERRRDCARLLLSAGAAADLGNSRDGDTPLHVAANLGDLSMVNYLIQRGGCANKNIRNKCGNTAYDVAAEHGHSRLFDALRLGDSLCSAARVGEAGAIRKLLEEGAAVNGRDQHGWTALHRAAFKGRVEAVRALIEKGVEVEARDEEGYTALHCAAEAGHVDVVEVLVKRRADVEARTNKGATAVEIAESLQYSGIARVLGYGVTDTASFGKEEPAEAKTKRRSGRGRAVRANSFGQSLPLAVV